MPRRNQRFLFVFLILSIRIYKNSLSPHTKTFHCTAPPNPLPRITHISRGFWRLTIAEEKDGGETWRRERWSAASLGVGTNNTPAFYAAGGTLPAVGRPRIGKRGREGFTPKLPVRFGGGEVKTSQFKFL